MNEKDLIQACKRQERRAQKLLYNRYSPVMFGVCRRYVRHREDAEDVLAEAFFKVLTKINQYTGKGNFEGWIRRIVVNESLMFLRKIHNFHLTVEISDVDVPTTVSIEDELVAQDIIELLSDLPVGYRTVFNLYVLEGFKHREIAEQLGISIHTSKSQLRAAKKRLVTLLKQNRYPGLGGFGKKKLH